MPKPQAELFNKSSSKADLETMSPEEMNECLSAFGDQRSGLPQAMDMDSWSRAFIWPCVFVHIGGVGWGGVGHVLTFM